MDKSVKNRSKSLLSTYFRSDPPCLSLYMDMLVDKFKETKIEKNPVNFLKFCSKNMNSEVCLEAFTETMDQSDSNLWFHLRFGRITASKFHEAANCTTGDGVLVESILGGLTFKSWQMERGTRLEPLVFDELKKSYVDIRKCGLLLKNSVPIFGASPDGCEIKCPSKESNVPNYIKNNIINKKYFAQIQLQMHMSGRKKGIFVVAQPTFEKDRQLILKEVQYEKKTIVRNK